MSTSDHVSTSLKRLRTKIFADGAAKSQMLILSKNPMIRGFTTNPTLMKKAGVEDYEAFARDVLGEITDKPISFEVFSDDFGGMEQQARKISSWGDNVYVKIPVTNTLGEPSYGLVEKLSKDGVKINVTAIMLCRQVEAVARAVTEGAPCCVSVFAGRIADTGRDPVPIMREAVQLLSPNANAELIWASPRELLNVFQADEVGCHIITVTEDVLKKLEIVDRDLANYSLDTVKMFHRDATEAGYQI